MNKFYYQTPIGKICIRENKNSIIGLDIEETKQVDGFIEEETSLIKETHNQLCEYFEGNRKTFSIPIFYEGSEFQKSVWKALLSIPYGQTKTYGQIAEEIENPKAVRAVGGACHRNSIIILIPCHRVIGSNDSLVGFGCGLDVKSYLLNLEKK